MPDILDEAAELINSWRSCPDPIKAMRALQRRAPPEMRGYFLLLWSDLVREMNEPDEAASVEDGQIHHLADQDLGTKHERSEAGCGPTSLEGTD